jgi:glycosyltransferase involved in cell wall biosynthesis
MVFPMNAPVTLRSDVLPILMPDRLSDQASASSRKIHFLRRTMRNPLTLLRLLQQEPPSLVIFNDFEQLTAPIWVPMFKAMASKHRYAVILHDPDRDNYPPSKRTSTRCMKALMSLMDLGLYHQHLPDKPYYKGKKTVYLDVPHGLYPPPAEDDALAELLANIKRPELQYATILGNIRPEKNYSLALQALVRFPGMGLIVAGKASNQNISTDTFKAEALALGVAERVIWLERFLTEAEMAAVIHASDLILLYYARSFTSQSGILNTVAPLKKTIVASDGESSLAQTIGRFNIGLLAEPDNLDAFCAALDKALAGEGPHDADWARYLEYASWAHHANVVVAAAAGVQV